MLTIAEALNAAAGRLGGESPRLDAEVLLAHALGRSRTYLFTWPEQALTADQAGRFEALVARRAAGEPVAYVLGMREFWSLELAVTPDTLIPRPDTELLVECALESIPAGADWRIADLGTGTGAVALAIARERPHCRVLATDLSPGTLAVARGNAGRNGIANVEFRPGDWFEPLAGERLELILSNPPYIAEGDPHLARGDVRFEPRRALASGPDGLDAIRNIVATAPAHLTAGGRLLLEHGFEQAVAVRNLLREGGFDELFSRHDLQGHPRVSGGTATG